MDLLLELTEKGKTKSLRVIIGGTFQCVAVFKENNGNLYRYGIFLFLNLKKHVFA